MRKCHTFLLAVLVVFLMFPHGLMAAEKPGLDISADALNSTPMHGPEGIVIGPDGNIYVSERDGRIRRVTPDGDVEDFANVNDLPGERDKRISAIGMAIDRNGDIYTAAGKFENGAVLKVVGPGKEDAGKVSIYRTGITMANFVLIDDKTETMYVSNSSMFGGGVFRIDMKDETKIGEAVDLEKDLLGKFGYANGLALGPEGKFLYVAETTKGRVSKIDLATHKAEVFVDVGGWTDGLWFDSERQLLFICENKGGRIVAVDLSGTVKGDVRVIGKEGQCAPASMVFRDSNKILFTDLWKPSMWDVLFKSQTFHSYAYEISVDAVLK